MRTAELARLCHEVNRGYCAALGDTSHQSWEQSSQALRDSVISGVEYARANHVATPQEMHAEWSRHKVVSGWIHGPIKDEGLKTHPNILPFDELPPEERIKDHLFIALIRAVDAGSVFRDAL